MSHGEQEESKWQLTDGPLMPSPPLSPGLPLGPCMKEREKQQVKKQQQQQNMNWIAHFRLILLLNSTLPPTWLVSHVTFSNFLSELLNWQHEKKHINE